MALVPRISAAEELDGYLRQLQYEPVACERSEQNELLLPAELHGAKLRFLLDTGAYTSLRPGSVSGLKTIGQAGAVLEDQLLGRITNASVFLMDKLVIGRAEFMNQPAWPDELKMNSIRRPFDGILGADFLIRNYCLLDCGAGRIYFRAGKPSQQYAQAMAESLSRSGFNSVPIGVHGVMTMDVSINREPARLGIDTGSEFSLLQAGQLKRLGLRTLSMNDVQRGTISQGDATAIVSGLGRIGKHELRVTVAKSLRVGDRSWDNVYMGIADLSAWKIGTPGGSAEDVDGLFGYDLLTGHGALIDFAAGTIWFRPEKHRYNCRR